MRLAFPPLLAIIHGQQEMIIARPKFVSVPLGVGLKWAGGGGYRYEEKMDGVWSVRTFGETIIAGEQMRNGEFYAFDVLQHNGQDLRRLPLRERITVLDDLGGGELAGQFLRPACGQGAEFLEAVLERGGEGVVAKYLDSPFGVPWAKCKRVETFDLIVTEKITPSIRLATLEGEDRGWCYARAAFNLIRAGDVVEIAAYALTAKGKLREPRFVRIRNDKTSPL